MALIIPGVFADAVNAKMDTSIRIGRVAFDATPLVSEITQAGDTVHFPQINRVATATDVIKGTALVPAEVDMVDSTATLRQIASSMRVFDRDAKQIKGQVIDSVVEQVATAMAKRIDSDLVVAMDSEAIYKSPVAVADKITSAELQAGMSLFGDDIDTNSFAGIVIHSRLLPSFLAMDEFISTNKTFNKNSQASWNGIIVDGIVGYYLGIPLLVCNNNTFDDVKKECKTYLVKKNSIGYVFQKNIGVEEEREGKLLATTIISSSLYACKLIDLKGVVICRKTVV